MSEWVDYDITVPLNYLDLTRATDQVAIEVSHLLGRGVQTRKGIEKPELSQKIFPERAAPAVATVESRVILSILGRLKRETFCNAKIKYFYVQGVKNRERLRKYIKEPLGHDFVRAVKGAWDFDLAILPCDGLSNLLHGNLGPVLSIIAGGPTGIFNESLKEESNRDYIVITVKSGPDNTGKLLPPKLRAESKDKFTESLLKTLADIKLIDKLIEGSQNTSYPERFTIATHTDNSNKNPPIAPVISRYTRIYDLSGSPFGAGCSPFFPKTGIDAAILIVKSAHLIAIAAAASATGNDFYAFPFIHDKSDDILKVESNTTVYRAKDIIKGDDVFVVITGICDNLILDGVQYTQNGLAITHSMCIRSKTYSQRCIKQQHNLSLKQFHHFDSSKPLSYSEVLKKYLNKR